MSKRREGGGVLSFFPYAAQLSRGGQSREQRMWGKRSRGIRTQKAGTSGGGGGGGCSPLFVVALEVCPSLLDYSHTTNTVQLWSQTLCNGRGKFVFSRVILERSYAMKFSGGTLKRSMRGART